MQPQQQTTPQTVTLHHGGIIGPYKDHTALRAEILKREPVEPARSPKQLFITDWLAKHKKKKLADAKEAWKVRCDSKTSFCEKNVEILLKYENAVDISKILFLFRPLVSKKRRSGLKSWNPKDRNILKTILSLLEDLIRRNLKCIPS